MLHIANLITRFFINTLSAFYLYMKARVTFCEPYKKTNYICNCQDSFTYNLPLLIPISFCQPTLCGHVPYMVPQLYRIPTK